MKSVDLDYMRKIQNCLPFADEGAGIQETQQAIGEMIAELGELRKQLADLRGEVSTCLTSAILGTYGDACNPNPPNRAWWSGGTWLHPGDVVIELSGEEFRRLT